MPYFKSSALIYHTRVHDVPLPATSLHDMQASCFCLSYSSFRHSNSIRMSLPVFSLSSLSFSLPSSITIIKLHGYASYRHRGVVSTTSRSQQNRIVTIPRSSCPFILITTYRSWPYLPFALLYYFAAPSSQ